MHLRRLQRALQTRRDPEAPGGREHTLADFDVTAAVWTVLGLSPVAGALAAGAALALLDLIGLVMHLAYSGTVGFNLAVPGTTRLGPWSVLVPVAGGAVIGAMAYWGSERIRGHGIPEAMETILVGGSRVEPRLAILKPISSAVSIGTGGPFGAEGPIILTGGALGSILAQLFHLAAVERRALLVAGACAGMAAVFGTPVAATVFGVELLAFEWRPRSLAPIGVAVVTASVIRNLYVAHRLIGAVPLFPLASRSSGSALAIGIAAAVGVAGGLLAVALTAAVYGAEDLFGRLPVHWAFWPAIGGLVIGLGGLIDARVLGVGYATIGATLAGQIGVGSLVLLMVTKTAVWSVGLGSGTSGGILAPLLLIGAAMGGLLGAVVPVGDPPTWALIGMAGTLAGVTRSPLTSVIFAFELTHDTGALLPLLIAATLAYLVSARVLKRSILTEKVARRGFHVVREYAVEPLEALLVREAMLTEVLTVRADDPIDALRRALARSPLDRRQRLYPVIDEGGRLTGIITQSEVFQTDSDGGSARAADFVGREVIVAQPGETLRAAADRMAEHGVGALPVVDGDGRRLQGVVTAFDLLKSRQRQMHEERHRERVIRFRRRSGLRGCQDPVNRR